MSLHPILLLWNRIARESNSLLSRQTEQLPCDVISEYHYIPSAQKSKVNSPKWTRESDRERNTNTHAHTKSTRKTRTHLYFPRRDLITVLGRREQMFRMCYNHLQLGSQWRDQRPIIYLVCVTAGMKLSSHPGNGVNGVLCNIAYLRACTCVYVCLIECICVRASTV